MDVQGPLGAPYVDAIKRFEGFAPRASWDYKQFTNGYGTRAQHPGETIDQDEAERRLAAELGNAGGQVATQFPGLPAGHHAALTSLTFNAGPGWMNSGLGEAVRKGDWDTARSLFQNYNRAGGSALPALARRRAEEASWFDGEPGALSYAGDQPALSPAFKQSGRTNMGEVDPALSARFMTGSRGSLFGDIAAGRAPESSDIKNSLQSAAGWMMALDQPSALSAALQPRDDFSLVTGQDGSMYRVNKKTGQVLPVAGANPKIVKIGTGPLGDIQGIQRGDKVYDMSGGMVMDLANPGATAGGGATGRNGSDLGLSEVLKPGVKYDDSLPAWDRVSQFKPEIAAAIKNYYHGESMPTGRGDKFRDFVKTQAQRVGEETGQPVSDATFAGKRTAITDLSKANPASHGGQAVLALTALEHLGEVKKAFAPLHNTDLSDSAIGGIPGTGYLARGANAIKNSGASSDPAKKQIASSTTRYGEESSKYYAGSAAAQAERERVHGIFNNPNMQPGELQGALKQERDLMADKINNNIAQLSSILGPEHPRVVELKDRLNKTLSKVDAELSGTAKRKPLSSFQ